MKHNFLIISALTTLISISELNAMQPDSSEPPKENIFKRAVHLIIPKSQPTSLPSFEKFHTQTSEQFSQEYGTDISEENISIFLNYFFPKFFETYFEKDFSWKKETDALDDKDRYAIADKMFGYLNTRSESEKTPQLIKKIKKVFDHLFKKFKKTTDIFEPVINPLPETRPQAVAAPLAQFLLKYGIICALSEDVKTAESVFDCFLSEINGINLFYYMNRYADFYIPDSLFIVSRFFQKIEKFDKIKKVLRRWISNGLAGGFEYTRFTPDNPDETRANLLKIYIDATWQDYQKNKNNPEKILESYLDLANACSVSSENLLSAEEKQDLQKKYDELLQKKTLISSVLEAKVDELIKNAEDKISAAQQEVDDLFRNNFYLTSAIDISEDTYKKVKTVSNDLDRMRLSPSDSNPLRYIIYSFWPPEEDFPRLAKFLKPIFTESTHEDESSVERELFLEAPHDVQRKILRQYINVVWKCYNKEDPTSVFATWEMLKDIYPNPKKSLSITSVLLSRRECEEFRKTFDELLSIKAQFEQAAPASSTSSSSSAAISPSMLRNYSSPRSFSSSPSPFAFNDEIDQAIISVAPEAHQTSSTTPVTQTSVRDSSAQTDNLSFGNLILPPAPPLATQTPKRTSPVQLPPPPPPATTAPKRTSPVQLPPPPDASRK